MKQDGGGSDEKNDANARGDVSRIGIQRAAEGGRKSGVDGRTSSERRGQGSRR